MHLRTGDSRIDHGLVLKVYHRPLARVYTNFINLASVLVENSFVMMITAETLQGPINWASRGPTSSGARQVYVSRVRI